MEACLAVLLICLPLAQTVMTVLQLGGSTVPGDGAARVQTVLVERLYQLATQLFAVLCLSFQQARASHLLLVQQQQVVVAVARSLPHVPAIHSQLSPDGQMTLVILGLDEDSDAAVADVPLLQVWLEAVPGPIHLHLTGEAAGATVLQQVDPGGHDQDRSASAATDPGSSATGLWRAGSKPASTGTGRAHSHDNTSAPGPGGSFFLSRVW